VKHIVIDASMAISWLMEDERTPAGNKILAELTVLTPIATPLLWHEVRNILVQNEKRGRLEAGGALPLLQSLQALGIKKCEDSTDERICALAFQHQLTAYDAAYLALALEYDAMLATNDRPLARAARASGLTLRTLLDANDL